MSSKLTVLSTRTVWNESFCHWEIFLFMILCLVSAISPDLCSVWWSLLQSHSHSFLYMSWDFNHQGPVWDNFRLARVSFSSLTVCVSGSHMYTDSHAVIHNCDALSPGLRSLMAEWSKNPRVPVVYSSQHNSYFALTSSWAIPLSNIHMAANSFLHTAKFSPSINRCVWAPF